MRRAPSTPHRVCCARSWRPPRRRGSDMRVLGMISGTSHDGIDIAIVDFSGNGEGDAAGTLAATIEYTTSTPYSSALRERLRAALPPSPVGFDVACELDTAIGQEFGEAARAALHAHSEAGF